MGWIYPPEVVPLYIRSKAVSLATSVNWAGNFSLTFFTPPAFKNIQWKVCPKSQLRYCYAAKQPPQVYMIFGTILMGSLIHVYLFFQETRGRTLEEMDEVFDQSVWAFKVHYTSRLAADVDKAREMVDSGKADTVEAEVIDESHKEKQ